MKQIILATRPIADKPDAVNFAMLLVARNYFRVLRLVLIYEYIIIHSVVIL